MQSVSTLSGAPVELPTNRPRIILEIYQEWAGQNPVRLRQLLILQAIGDGWSQAEIARALGCDRKNLGTSIKRARRSIRQFADERGLLLDPERN